MAESSSRTQSFRGPRMTFTPKVIGVLVLLVLSLVLMLQNWDEVNVNLLFWDFDIRLVWALLAVFILGALIGWLVPRVIATTRRSRVRVTTS